MGRHIWPIKKKNTREIRFVSAKMVAFEIWDIYP